MTREEAIKIIRDTYHTDTELEALKVLVPELKESEDEKIRKAIVTLIKDLQHYSTNYAGVDPTEMLAWLEKQKEQKSISAEAVLVKAGLQPYKDGNQWCILAGANIQEGICGFGDTIEDALYEFLKEVLDLQKGRQPAEWNEEDEYCRNQLIVFCENCMQQDSAAIRCANWLKSLPKRFNLQPQAKQEQKEHKPEVKLTGWVARDKKYDSDSRLGLVLFNEKPRRAYTCWNGDIVTQLPWELFQDLKWNDEPMEVEITIRKK